VRKDRPILQLALDYVDLARAIKCAEEAVPAGVDWLEAGTPLIKSEGLNAVRELHRRFPNVPIVADMKTIDAGRAEVEMAAKAGAAVVAVLGVASDSTLAECVESASRYGAKVSMDLIESPQPVERARQLEALGADYIGVHTAIDMQMRAADPLAVLREVCATVSIPVAAAGGINSETAAEAVKAGARIVIVGGAITKSADARSATEAIRRALDEGVAVASQLYRRTAGEQVREIFQRVSTANISDARHCCGDLPGLRQVTPGVKVVGTAVTVRSYPGDFSKPVQAIDVAEAGQVIVVESRGRGPAVWGELATHSALRRELAGVVIDGGIRDTGDIRELAFPAWARVITPTRGEPRGLGEINVPITVCGVAVEPGDWLIGDDDGVIVVPAARAVEIANRSMDVLEYENRWRKEIHDGRGLGEVTELAKWDKHE
jgi:3-hexulose-6-phosphate synthase/6-phospho-3-hexuloisomerase